MTPHRIPIYRPELGEPERRLVLEALDSGWISSKGAFIERFERGFAARLGVAHAASTCNGTTALHLALLALGIGPGDEVIVPTLTYVASANAVRYVGARPVLADVEPDGWQLDPADVERRITPRTRAIMAVHLYGLACDMDRLGAIAARHGLALVEDCAEALGATWRGRPAGTLGDVAAFSFFGNKTITTGEGGMVACRDAALIDRVRRYRGQGLAADREYWHDLVGYNYRMTNLCAALGVAQLERLDALVARKREIARRYLAALAGLGLRFQAEGDDDRVHGQWMVSILLEAAADRDPLRAHLSRAGIETRPVFHPLHTMPIHAPADGAPRPVAESIAARGINLPSWPGLPDAAVDEVAGHVRDWLRARPTALERAA